VPIASALRCADVCAGLTGPAAQGCLRLYAVPCFVGVCRLPVLRAVRALFVQAFQALPRKVVCVFTP